MLNLTLLTLENALGGNEDDDASSITPIDAKSVSGITCPAMRTSYYFAYGFLNLAIDPPK